MRGRKVTLHGNGTNKRNFLFVEDVARAFEIVLFKAKEGLIYNIGGSNEIPNIDVAKDLIRLSGHKGDPSDMMVFVNDRVFNDLRYHINSDRLFELGYHLLTIYLLLSIYKTSIRLERTCFLGRWA